MPCHPSPITSSVLAWAIKEDGRSPVELAEKLKVDRSLLEEWTAGDSRPTIGQVSELVRARQERTPSEKMCMPRMRPFGAM